MTKSDVGNKDSLGSIKNCFSYWNSLNETSLFSYTLRTRTTFMDHFIGPGYIRNIQLTGRGIHRM
uniref:Uncharacterized protein n=1 Tax=Aegilops tauschii subsp. strangulata TaxID=200361 RepID=A0A452YYR5_AEGTS